MENQLLKLDGGSTPKEAQRIKEYLGCREKELYSVSKAIQKELNRNKASLTAISNIESTLLDSRKAIEISEGGLRNLRAVESTMWNLRDIGMNHLDIDLDEPDSLQLCREHYRLISDYTSLSTKVVNSQVELLRDRVHLLEDHLHSMEKELEGWRRLHKLTTASLGHLNLTKAHIEEEIRSAMPGSHPIQRVPPDIWIYIFKYVIDGEFSAYLEHNCNAPLRSTPHTLSHVCQLWRRAVRGTKALWRLTAGHPCTMWPRTKYNLFIDAMDNSGQPLTILINLSQTLSWSRGVGERTAFGVITNQKPTKNNSGELISPINIRRHGRLDFFENEDDECDSGDYDTLFIDMENDARDVILKAGQIPFQQPSGLVLSSRNPLKDGNILSALSRFQGIKSLTIKNESPVCLPSATLSSTLPKLEYLELAFGRFPARFQIDGYLTETLKEVHIHDNNSTSLPSPTTGLQLPTLHTLGINYPAQVFLEAVKMPTLTTLVLYPFNFLEHIPTASAQAIAVYRQLKHLRFQGWNAPEDMRQRSEVTGAFSRLAPHTPTLQSLTFDHCYINGGALLGLFKTLKKMEKAKLLANFQEIALSYTEGITRGHCDELKQVVGNIKVFR
ncbi:hypothetical protein FRC14_003311 [Serendipita sp. 396]|nr:hypothetical protein FRC14_003311 [Serendipita sp. 396]KAG8779845.1 hypothetical protein FRC15_009904 [Serendipita sp. 397]KAG8800673.1 hypothetical protein FRC16_002311 [Serendipita sp. 398]KAG8865462.1 hypothetical protein FRC20_009813 [Serendipita sp. 405]